MSLNKGKDINRFYVWVETSGTGPPSVWKTYVYQGQLISKKYSYFSLKFNDYKMFSLNHILISFTQ